MTTKPHDEIRKDVVNVSVLIAAEPETVWSFLSDGGRFAAWIGAFAGQPPLEGTRVDPRVGGEIRVCYPGTNVGIGKISAFEPPRRLAFSWGYEGGDEGIAPGSTQVEITLAATAGGTLVELRHSGIPTQKAREGHFGGWKHYLSMLARAASDAFFRERLAAVCDAYFAAWCEADDAKRLAFLNSACEPDVRLRTAFACTDGVAEFSAHIAGGLRNMPGLTLTQTAPPQQLHGSARVTWSVRTPDGKDIFRGTNFMTLSAKGRLAAVVSFGD